MAGNSRYTRRSAMGLIAAGVIVTATETFGFSNLNANRATTVSSAADPNALLGIEGTANQNGTPAFTNRSVYQMDVTISTAHTDAEFEVGDSGAWEDSSVQFDLQSGERTEVGMRGGESIVVDVNAVLRENGDRRGTIELQREFEPAQADQLEVTPNVKPAGASGKLEFELENTGDLDVTIVGIGINRTRNDDGTTNDDVDEADSLEEDDLGVIVDESIPIDSTDPAHTRRDFDPVVPLTTGQQRDFEFDRFRTNGGNADMQGVDVQITLYFDDGSSVTDWLEQ